jgi:hypothetical protein
VGEPKEALLRASSRRLNVDQWYLGCEGQESAGSGNRTLGPTKRSRRFKAGELPSTATARTFGDLPGGSPRRTRRDPSIDATRQPTRCDGTATARPLARKNG